MRTPSALLASVLLLATGAAHADWPAQGRFVLLTSDSFHGTSSVWISDLATGDLLVRGTGVGGNANGYDVQRISPFGDIAPGWPARGVSFGTLGKAIREWSRGFAVDDQGSAWHAALVGSGNVGAQRVTLDGVRLPIGSGWPFTSVSMSDNPTAFAPAPGGIYAYFGNRVQRLTREGTVAAGWPANGRTTSGVGTDNAAIADGSGGVVVMSTYLGPTVQRFDSTGTAHGGVVLSDDGDDQLADFLDAPQFPDLLPSDATHYLAGWTAPYNSSIKRAKLQRVGYDGALDPAWPSAGLEVVAADSITGVTALPDRSGGVYVLWYAHGVPRGTHVRADGSFEPGTDAAGVPLPAPEASYALPLRSPGLNSVLPYVPADATPDGRLIFAWDDGAIVRSIRVRWLLADLTPDPSEPLAGRLIQPNDLKTYVRAVHSDGTGGAYIAWESSGTDPVFNADNGEIWMTRLLPSSLAGVPAQPYGGLLALSAPRPNPSRGDVTLQLSLPDDSPARVELLDVAGRVQRSQSVAGAGAHSVAFKDLGTLAPGLYFARASHAGGAATTRVVIAR